MQERKNKDENWTMSSIVVAITEIEKINGDELGQEKNQEPWLAISGLCSLLDIYMEILGTKVRYKNLVEFLMTICINFRVTAYRWHLKP